MYIVQSLDLFGFRDEFASSNSQIAFNYMKQVEKLHGKKYKIIKKY